MTVMMAIQFVGLEGGKLYPYTFIEQGFFDFPHYIVQERLHSL